MCRQTLDEKEGANERMTVVSDNCKCSKCIKKYRCPYYKVIVLNQQMMSMTDRFMSEANKEWCLVLEMQVRECSERQTYEEAGSICTPLLDCSQLTDESPLNNRKDIIHKRVILNGKEHYKCNHAVNALPFKMVDKYAQVTCKNCLRNGD
jgi:hypothetical protein